MKDKQTVPGNRDDRPDEKNHVDGMIDLDEETRSPRRWPRQHVHPRAGCCHPRIVLIRRLVA